MKRSFKQDRLVPPGYPIGAERTWFFLGLTLVILYSFTWFSDLTYSLNRLYDTFGTKRILIPGAQMADFRVVLGPKLLGFPILALSMGLFVASHYSYHYQETRSIYLMKRLPDARELHRRCWALPLLLAACSLVLGFLLLVLYFGIYMLVTPDACLTPNQWMKLWRF